jgi:hypothetical protein
MRKKEGVTYEPYLLEDEFTLATLCNESDLESEAGLRGPMRYGSE